MMYIVDEPTMTGRHLGVMDELESSKAVLLLRLALAGSALQRGHHPRQLGLLLLLAGCSALKQHMCYFRCTAVLLSSLTSVTQAHAHIQPVHLAQLLGLMQAAVKDWPHPALTHTTSMHC